MKIDREFETVATLVKHATNDGLGHETAVVQVAYYIADNC
jgi:hypothetical protein